MRRPPVAASVLALALAPLVDARPAQDTVALEAAWGPIVSSTYDLHQKPDVARALGAGPATTRAEYPLEALRALLPPADVLAQDDAEVVWELDVERVLPFLAQLHPGVTKRLRHAHVPEDLAEILREQGDDPAGWTPPAVEGGRATLLSKTEDELAVLLRVHVEFELIPERLYFLPAQFEGHLVWDRAADRARCFHLALPPRDTNYDINYVGAADIGYLPRMLVATKGAEPAGADAEPARQRMRESFYPALRIRWRSLAEAQARAEEDGRRLHVIQLFGTFDDESC